MVCPPAVTDTPLTHIVLVTCYDRCQRSRMADDDRACVCCRAFQFLFYIDFMASMAEERAQNALRHLQVRTPHGGRTRQPGAACRRGQAHV